MLVRLNLHFRNNLSAETVGQIRLPEDLCQLLRLVARQQQIAVVRLEFFEQCCLDGRVSVCQLRNLIVAQELQSLIVLGIEVLQIDRYLLEAQPLCGQPSRMA